MAKKNLIEIEFDAHLFETQKKYNLIYEREVNSVLERLKTEIEDLTSEDIEDFVNSPHDLCERLVNKDAQEFEAYVSTLPKSVQKSIKFKSNKPDIIIGLYRSLPKEKSFFLKINTCKIKNGKCQFDEGALREACLVYGSEDAATAWKNAKKVAEALTLLREQVKMLNSSMGALEDRSLLQMGLIRTEDGKTYNADINRLRELL